VASDLVKAYQFGRKKQEKKYVYWFPPPWTWTTKKQATLPPIATSHNEV